MQIEPGRYRFRAVYINVNGETEPNYSRYYLVDSYEELRQKEKEFIGYLKECGCKDIRITHATRKPPENESDYY